MSGINLLIKICSLEFKESSVKLAIESKHPIAHTARDLGINAKPGLINIQNPRSQICEQMRIFMMN